MIRDVDKSTYYKPYRDSCQQKNPVDAGAYCVSVRKHNPSIIYLLIGHFDYDKLNKDNYAPKELINPPH